MPKLSDIELRIFLVIFNKTVGYGKERDWISHVQFKNAIRIKKGKPRKSSSRHISKGITALISEFHLIEAESEKGKKLTTPLQRMKNYGRIYYRIAGLELSTESTKNSIKNGLLWPYNWNVDKVWINGWVPVEKSQKPVEKLWENPYP